MYIKTIMLLILSSLLIMGCSQTLTSDDLKNVGPVCVTSNEEYTQFEVELRECDFSNYEGDEIQVNGTEKVIVLK